MKKSNNIALIGMAGVGKTYLSGLLAKELNYTYIELDAIIEIQAQEEGLNFQALEDKDFKRIEKQILISLPLIENTILDTGGSVIYTYEGMQALKNQAIIVYIKDNVEEIEKRFHGRDNIPMVGMGEKTFSELFVERENLYKQYCDVTVVRNMQRINDAERIVEEIIQKTKLR